MNKKKRVIYIVQIIIAIVLCGLMIYKGKTSWKRDIQLADFKSDYIGCNDGKWSVSSGAIESEDNIVLLYGPYETIKPGSYSVTLDYYSDSKMTCRLFSAERGEFIHASDFYLSPNNNQVTYNFYVTQSIYDLEIRIVDYSGDEAFTLSGASLSSTARDMRVLVFTWIAISLLVNYFAFSKCYKNNRRAVLCLLGIAFIGTLSYMFPGIAPGHDFPYHILRIEGIADGMRSGQFPVRMHSVFMDGFGYPNGIFYGDLFLYVPAVLRIIGFSINTSYKLYVFLVSLLTAYTTYYMGRRIFKNDTTALVVALSYVTASYRIVDVFVRSAVGEYTALAFYPIVAVAIWQLYTGKESERNYNSISLTLATGMLGLLYTHVLSTEMVCIVLVAVAISQYKKTFTKNVLLTYAKAVGIFIALGLAFIVPFLDYYMRVATEIKATNGSVKLIQSRGAYIADLFAVFRDFYGEGEDYVVYRMQITPGLVLMASLIVAAYLLVNKKATKEIKYITISSLVLLFVSSNLFPWNKLAFTSKLGNILAQIQYPWRYIGIAIVFLAILLGLILEYFVENEFYSEKIYAVIIAMALVSTALFIGSAEDNATGVTKYYDTAQLDRGAGAIGYGEYLIEGTDTSDLIAINLYKGDLSAIDIPKYNYPYYKAYDENGNELAISNGINNRICVSVESSYNGDVTVKFVEPILWRIAEVISLLSAISLLIIYKRKGIGRK